MKRLLVALLPLFLSSLPAPAHEGSDQLGKSVSRPRAMPKSGSVRAWRGDAPFVLVRSGAQRPSRPFCSRIHPVQSPTGASPWICSEILWRHRRRAENAQTAWEALEKARAIGAKTQRERDWIEALSAYSEITTRWLWTFGSARTIRRWRRLTQRYPNDFEAGFFTP